MNTDDQSPSTYTKDHWRALARRWRKEMGAPARAAASARIQAHVLASPHTAAAQTIALYASFGAEAQTHELILALLAAGKRVALPRVIHHRHELELHRVDAFPAGFEAGDFGILEPSPAAHPEIIPTAEVELFLVPALVYDQQLFRIGYGGGYFDRLLNQPHGGVAVGLAFACQLIPAFEHDPWDRPVDALCTEEGFLAPAPPAFPLHPPEQSPQDMQP